MNYTNIVIGTLLLAGSMLYLINILKRTKNIEKGDYLRYTNYIKIYGGIFILMIIGIILIFNELI